jgi:RimJ/RimL family protein N-acetyltransferase
LGAPLHPVTAIHVVIHYVFPLAAVRARRSAILRDDWARRLDEHQHCGFDSTRAPESGILCVACSQSKRGRAVQEVSSSEPTFPMILQLRDGREVTVRPIRPEDKEELHAAVLSLSPDSRYSRFMAPKRELSSKTLDAATNPNRAQEFALVAFDGKSADTIVAGARYASTAGSETCEFAVTITDQWQGAGLARRLMEIIMQVAARAGYETMEGFVLATNRSMRGLAQRLGFSDKACPDERGVRLVTRSLQPREESKPQ